VRFWIRHSTNWDVASSTFGALSSGTWYFLLGYHDAASNLVAVSVNGGAFDTTSTAGRVPLDRTNPLRISSYDGVSQMMNGREAYATFGKSPVAGIAAVATEVRDYLYNAGAGRAYPGGWT
jgi:hypothetical protein